MDIKLTTNSIIHCTERQQYNNGENILKGIVTAKINNNTTKKSKDMTFDKMEQKRKIDLLPTDVYCHGDLERGDEIIASLEKLGGVNPYSAYSGKNKKQLYYISKDKNYIKCCDPEKDKELTSFITRFYKMLTLPPIEIIEIEGKKYKKEEVFEKLKDLKTY